MALDQPDADVVLVVIRPRHNANPKPFVWTKSTGEILEKVARAKQALESVH